MAVSAKGDGDLVKLLLEKGISPNIQNKNGSTPLYNAVLLGNTEMAALLVEHGANPCIREYVQGGTALKRKNPEALLLFLAFFLPGYLLQSSMAAHGAVSTAALLQSIVAGIPQVLLMAYIAGVRAPFSAPRWGLVPLAPRDAAQTALLVVLCFALVTPLYAAAVSLPGDTASRTVSTATALTTSA